MTTRTLLARIYDAYRLKKIENMLEPSFEGLDVKAEIVGVAAGRWAQLSLSGEDEAVATNYVAREIGFCPVSFENVARFSTLKGFVSGLEKSREELFVDVGVFEPRVVHASVPLRHLQAQLVDGRKVALKKIAELFGFCEDLPIIVKVDKEESSMEAELSDVQLKRFTVWRESLLDRLLVMGPAVDEIKMTLERAGLSRDVLGVEPMGVFSHALICKLGTDAAGLIPKIGRKLKNARFAVFNPKRLRQFLEEA